MTTKPKAYIHLDLETTSLKAHTGHFYSIGCCVVGSNMAQINEPKVPNTYLATEMVPPDAWDKGTWDWAKKTYGETFVEAAIDAHATFQSWRATLTILCMDWAQWIRRWENAGYEPYIICNHSEFDATMLKAAFDQCDLQFPIHYRNILDLPSLIMGYTGKTAYEQMRAVVPVHKTTHNALQDAIDQANILAAIVPRLPE